METEKDTLRAIGTAVAVVILAVIAALVVGSILDSSVFSSGPVDGTNTNESLGSAVNATVNVTFDIIASQPLANCSLVSVNNATDGQILAAGNYTFFPDCKLIMQGGSTYIDEPLNATYNFTFIGPGSTIIDVNAVKVLFGEFITGLLGFLGIIGIVLGVIWLIMYVARLFQKGGLNDLGATA